MPGCGMGTWVGDAIIRNADDAAQLEGYDAIQGALYVQQYAESSLTELHCLQSVGGAVDIRENPGLVDLDGLEIRLQEVGGYLYVTLNPQLESIAALGSLGQRRRLPARHRLARARLAREGCRRRRGARAHPAVEPQ